MIAVIEKREKRRKWYGQIKQKKKHQKPLEEGEVKEAICSTSTLHPASKRKKEKKKKEKKSKCAINGETMNQNKKSIQKKATQYTEIKHKQHICKSRRVNKCMLVSCHQIEFVIMKMREAENECVVSWRIERCGLYIHDNDKEKIWLVRVVSLDPSFFIWEYNCVGGKLGRV